MSGSELSCRLCGMPLHRTFVDLGEQPLANAYVSPGSPLGVDQPFPLHVRVCDACLLVQLPEIVAPDDIFRNYAYFSSVSDSWVEHAREFAEAAVASFDLGSGSLVVEVASNDGYLLQHFLSAGVPVLGIEPATNVASAAEAVGVPTVVEFFGRALAESVLEERGSADLLIGNNVLAHVPDLHDFVGGLAMLLAPEGVLSLEFPHVQRLIEGVQFDTIYHEHFSYLSVFAVEEVLRRHGLRILSIVELATHGGSLRVSACHAAAHHVETDGARAVRAAEAAGGYHELEGYLGFADRVEEAGSGLLEFLRGAKHAGRSVVAYGAAAKGNTLLNSCGITTDLIQFVVDRSPHKQGKELPGSRLPILAPDAISEEKPDYLLILPWNIRDEVMAQMASIRSWGGKFVVPIPRVEVLP